MDRCSPALSALCTTHMKYIDTYIHLDIIAYRT